jgi:DtxR family Mn-dependent transcriptional regulator
MSHSLSKENYLKAIFHASQQIKGSVPTTAISKKVGAKPSSVTDMVQKLNEEGLLEYQKYKGVTLSEAGNKAALQVIRKHRLWESFLVTHLNFNWDEVHQVAEQLEHIQSDKLINELDRFLDFPTRDPHGDPIPNRAGYMKTSNKKLLVDMKVNQLGVCVGVKDNSSEFLQYLDKRNIGLGTRLMVLHHEHFDGSLHLQTDTSTLMISSKIAQNIYVNLL